MPVYDHKTVLEFVRGVKAFLKLELGVVRGPAPESAHERKLRTVRKEITTLQAELASREQELEAHKSQGREKGEHSRVRPGNIVWIFGTARVGSTWLVSMMEDLSNHYVWHEPLVGALFGSFYEGRAGADHLQSRNFILGRDRPVWLKSIREFVLDGAEARFPEMSPEGCLVIKEPNGSIGAPLMGEALPESRLIFLVRDPRDVVASVLDASRRGGWNYERPEDVEWKRKSLADTDPDLFVKKRARAYVRQIGASWKAYKAHAGPKALVRYEDLVTDTLGEMERLYSSLGIEVDEDELARVVEGHSWNNIPEEKKGEGKFYRRGDSGGWREDLTPEQAREVENITSAILEEFYPS